MVYTAPAGDQVIDLASRSLPSLHNSPKVVIDKIFQVFGATEGLTSSGGFSADSFIAAPVKIGAYDGGYYIDRYRGSNMRLAHSIIINKKGGITIETAFNKHAEPITVLKSDLRRLLDGLREASITVGSDLNDKLQGREVNWSGLYDLIENMN